MKINIILALSLFTLLQGCSPTPEKVDYYSLNDFTSGSLTIPDTNKGDEIDDDILENLDRQVKQRYWANLALYTFNTLNPQDLTYYYLGVASEGKGLYENALKYYNKAITHNKKGLTCTGTLYDDCNDLDFPSEIYKAIDRVNIKIKQVQFNNRVRIVTIYIDQPGSFFSINGDKYKSGESVKLTPGTYSVQYYSDNLFSEGEITLTSKGPSAESVTLSLRDDPKHSLTISDVDEAVETTSKIVKDFKGKAKNNTGMDKLSGLLDWKGDTENQYKSIQLSLLKLDRRTSLYKSTSKYALLLKDLNRLIIEKIVSTRTEDFSEYLTLANKINNAGIKASQVPIYNNAKLSGSEIFSTTPLSSLDCKSYVIATKNPLIEVRLINSNKSEYSSQYIQEYRDESNPIYSEVKSELRGAKYELEDKQYEHSQYSGGSYGALFIGIGQGLLEDKLKENITNLQSKLRNTPRTIRQEIKATYYPIRNNVSFVKENSAEWMSINCETGRVNKYKLIKEESKDFTLYEGVRSDDLNHLSSTNQSVKTQMRQWSNKAFISLDDLENDDSSFLLSTDVININSELVKVKIKEFLSSE